LGTPILLLNFLRVSFWELLAQRLDSKGVKFRCFLAGRQGKFAALGPDGTDGLNCCFDRFRQVDWRDQLTLSAENLAMHISSSAHGREMALQDVQVGHSGMEIGCPGKSFMVATLEFCVKHSPQEVALNLFCVGMIGSSP
jgi:hypothetical protein